MIAVDNAAVKRILVDEGYSDEGEIDMIFNELSIIDTSLQGVFNAYLKDRTIIDEFKVEGLTISIIMHKFSCDFWTALGFMNTAITSPQLAMELYNM